MMRKAREVADARMDRERQNVLSVKAQCVLKHHGVYGQKDVPFRQCGVEN